MPLFQVAIIERPTAKEAEDGAEEKLILKPVPVIAANEQAAGIVAVMENKDIEFNSARSQVLVIPFG